LFFNKKQPGAAGFAALWSGCLRREPAMGFKSAGSAQLQGKMILGSSISSLSVRQSDAVTLMFSHVSAEQGIDASLIPRSLLFVPFKHITIEPDGKLLFPQHRLQAPAHDGTSKHLG
jgi:hypothetical protein